MHPACCFQLGLWPKPPLPLLALSTSHHLGGTRQLLVGCGSSGWPRAGSLHTPCCPAIFHTVAQSKTVHKSLALLGLRLHPLTSPEEAPNWGWAKSLDVSSSPGTTVPSTRLSIPIGPCQGREHTPRGLPTATLQLGLRLGTIGKCAHTQSHLYILISLEDTIKGSLNP